MININQLDPTSLATLSAIVAAVVAVAGDAFNLPKRYRSLVAIGLSVFLVFLPTVILTKILTACIIGITASGVYSQIKPSKLLGSLTDKQPSRESKPNNERSKPDNRKNYHNAKSSTSQQREQKEN